MSMTEEDVRHEVYVEDMVNGYNEALVELADSKDVNDLLEKIDVLQRHVSQYPEFMSKDTHGAKQLQETVHALSNIERIIQEVRGGFRAGLLVNKISIWVGGVGIIVGLAGIWIAMAAG